MKISLLSLFILSFTSTFASPIKKEISANDKARAKYLFIIVANGVRYNDAFGNKNHLYTDNIWNKLRPLGTICTEFHNPELTYPIPAQASLLTGVWQIVKNPLSDTLRSAYPTLFEYWKRKTPAEVCYFAAGNKKMDVLTYSNHGEYGRTCAPVFDNASVISGGDTGKTDSVSGIVVNTIYEKTASYIFQHHPSFVYLNSDSGSAEETDVHALECRITNKAVGCEGETNPLNAYYESIILTDASVYDLWNRIQRDEIYKDRSVFIFLSAHGRHTDDFHGYGCDCQGCQHLNFLIIGPGVKKNFISKRKRVLIDICRTVGVIFDLPTPYAKGKIMKEVLE